ncbi:hypothetical protein ACFL1Y_01035 [Patescibacteria group bacterium]
MKKFRHLVWRKYDGSDATVYTEHSTLSEVDEEIGKELSNKSISSLIHVDKETRVVVLKKGSVDPFKYRLNRNLPGWKLAS